MGADYAADPLVWHGPFKAMTVASLLRTPETVNAGGSLGDLPTLWVHGAEDTLVPVEPTRDSGRDPALSGKPAAWVGPVVGLTS